MEIKKADRAHIDEIMSLYKDAKIFMDNHGNKDQWPLGYPSKEMITKDTLEELESILDIRRMIVSNKDISKDYLKGIQYALDVLSSIYNRDMGDNKTVDTVSIKESVADTVPNKDSSITDNNQRWNFINRIN